MAVTFTGAGGLDDPGIPKQLPIGGKITDTLSSVASVRSLS